MTHLHETSRMSAEFVFRYGPKCMEHILVSNMMKHLELNNILHPLQHGFLKNYSCETQLLSLFQDLASNPSQNLGWEPLATRRRNMRLCMMYKIAHTVVGDPWTEWLTTTKRVTRGFHAWKYIPI